jgi:hypothetical protein
VLHLAPAHDACRNAVAAHDTVLGPFAPTTPWARFIDVPAPVLSHATPSHGSVRACLLGRNTSVSARRLDNCTVRCLVPASTAVYGSGRRSGVAFVTSSAGAVARTSSVLDVAAPTPLVDGLSVRLAQADGPAGAALVVGSSAPFSAPAASYQEGICVAVATAPGPSTMRGYRLRVVAEAGGLAFAETGAVGVADGLCNATRAALRHASAVGGVAAPSLRVTVTLVAGGYPPRLWHSSNHTFRSDRCVQTALAGLAGASLDACSARKFSKHSLKTNCGISLPVLVLCSVSSRRGCVNHRCW